MVTKISITGGKGGTGKSTIATALSSQLSNDSKVLLVDADVDCPDDNIILDIEQKKIKNIENMIPHIDKDKCIKCGLCSKVCKENAIIQVGDNYPIVIPERCSGCKACKVACPVNAITEEKQKIGEIYRGEKDNLTLVTGIMKPGIEESSLIINKLKKYISSIENDYDYIIIDTAAGTHCPFIAALSGTKLGIAVTEPTPLGEHDLKLILDLMEKLKVKSKIVINRCDIGDKNIINKASKQKKIPIISEIPYSKEIERNYAQGKLIKDKNISKIAKEIK